MCGIVGYTGTQQAKGILIDGLQHLEYRGYDSAGIAVFNGKEIEVVRRQGKVAELVAALGADDCLGTCGIGHTRWATHGAPSERNAHPHTSCLNNIAVVHNGIIENFNELREDLVLKGHVFSSDTDTEVVAHLVEDFYRGDLLEAVQKASSLLTGAYGIAVICTDEPGKMVITRKDSPIVVGCDSTGSYVASDIVALVPPHAHIVALALLMAPGSGGQDGKAHVIEPGGVVGHAAGLAAVSMAYHGVQVGILDLWDVGAVEGEAVIAGQPTVLAAGVEPLLFSGRLLGLAAVGRVEHGALGGGVQGVGKQVVARESHGRQQRG